MGLVAGLLLVIDLAELWGSLKALDLVWVGIGVAALLAAIALDGSRMFFAFGRRLSLLEGMRIHLVAGLFLNFFPGSLGGDAYKVYRLRGIGQSIVEPVTLVLLLRLLSLAVVLTFGLVGLIGTRREIGRLAFDGGGLSAWMIGAAAVAVLAAVAVGGSRVALAARRVWRDCVRAVRSISPASLWWLIALSIMMNVLRLLMFWCLFMAAGFHATAFVVAAVLAASVAATSVPVGIAGIGVRETAIAGSLVAFGMPAAAAVAVAFLARGMLLLTGFLGGVMFLFDGRRNDDDRWTGPGSDPGGDRRSAASE